MAPSWRTSPSPRSWADRAVQQPGAAEQVAAKAHTVCPYSNAVRGNVEVTVAVDPAPDVI